MSSTIDRRTLVKAGIFSVAAGIPLVGSAAGEGRADAASPRPLDPRRVVATGRLRTTPAYAHDPGLAIPIRVLLDLHPSGDRALILFDRIGPEMLAPGVPDRTSAGEIWLPYDQVERIFDVLTGRRDYVPWYEDMASHPLAKPLREED